MILIGGSVRDAAESASRGGWIVDAIDRFGDTDTLAASRTWTPLANWHGPVTKPARIVLGGGIAGPSRIWLHSLTHPTAAVLAATRAIDNLRSIADLARIRFPETRSKGPPNVDGWLRKDRDGCGGLGVSWANKRTDAATGDEVFQRWIAGRRYGIAYLASPQGTTLIGGCRSLHTRMGDRPFVWRGAIGPIAWSSRDRQTLEQIGCIVNAQIPIEGVFGIDLVRDRRRRWWLIEINPRWTGSMEIYDVAALADGSNCGDFWTPLMARSLATCFDDGDQTAKPGPRPGTQTLTIVKRVRFARTPFTWTDEHATALRSKNRTLHDVPAIGTSIQRHHPVVTTLEVRHSRCDQ